ncbi:ATPase, AAA-type, core [Cynara cardunculus var. scolymus]|uniref:ATPase, AAA-type, core n=1 Tax=Cynara cardunculus var. scolymus TaxID=59895 RepID=A0A103XPI1_CYNCS|nr:ATPase, AAA-type, core [Cynara cardunculus var. scolymus]
MVETRRSSSSSKRTLSSPCSSPIPTGKRSKAAEAASSSTTGTPVEPIEAVVKESGGCESQEQEVRSSDPSKKDSDGCDEVAGVDVPEKSPVGQVEGQPLVSPMSLGDSLIDVEKTKANGGSTVLNRTKKRQSKSNVGVAWGKLLSQCSQNPHVVMDRSIFTVGQGRQCDLCLGDTSISKSLCSLRHIESQQGGASITLLEITGGKGAVKVNGKVCPKRSTLPLRAGDEIFQQLSNDNVGADVAPSVSILEAHSGSLKGLQFEARSRDSSAVAGASILASLSNIQKELSLLPPPSRKGKGLQTGMPTLPSACEVPDNRVADIDMKDASDPNDSGGVPSCEKAVVTPDAVNENVDGVSVDAEMGNVPAATHELRPLLRMLAGSSASEFDILKILDERREIRELLKDIDPPISLAARRQAYKDSLQQGILEPDAIEVTFKDFPYYLSETTKSVLIASTYIHLKRNEFVKYASDLPTLCPRILLAGPAGSEIYQETLTKALAKHFGARLLVVDSLLLPGGSAAKETDTSLKESARPERASVFAKRAPQTGVMHSKKPTSSVEADIIGGSTTCSQAQPKQEASTASSKSYTFKKGAPRMVIRAKSYFHLKRMALPRLELDSIGQFKKAMILEEFVRKIMAFSVQLIHFVLILRVAVKESKSSSLLLFVKDIEKSMLGNPEAYASFKSKLENVPGNVVVIASHTQMDSRKEKSHPGGLLFTKFGSNQTTLLDLAFPDELLLSDWKQQLDRDIETLKSQSNIISIRSVLNRVRLESSNLDTLCIKDQTLTNESVEKVIGWALSHHFMQSSEASVKDAKPDVVTENEFEKRLIAEVIPPSDIGVTFDDIGALESVKDTLKELWFGEGEKYVKAVFSLASKISPSIVFVDEVDSMLGRRENPGEHEAMRKMKNEFMVNWDGLRTKDRERVLVLGATNRPFDLDEAVDGKFTRCRKQGENLESDIGKRGIGT